MCAGETAISCCHLQDLGEVIVTHACLAGIMDTYITSVYIWHHVFTSKSRGVMLLIHSIVVYTYIAQSHQHSHDSANENTWNSSMY